MEIETLWVTRKNEDVPEILEAWDEMSVDENPDGFHDACEEALSHVGDDLDEVRYITIRVSSDEISKAFAPTSLDASVISFRDKVGGASK